MAVASSVLVDNSFISRTDQYLYKIECKLALLSGLAVFALMMLAVISVSGRHLINQPLPGYVDWIEQAMPLIAFMGVAYTQRDGGHIRMDLIVSRLHGRALWTVEFITVFFILLVMLLITWGAWAHFVRSFDFASPLWSRDSSMDIALPLWPAKLMAPIAFGILSLRCIVQMCAYGKAIIKKETSPVGVPFIEDIATQAAKEADVVSR